MEEVSISNSSKRIVELKVKISKKATNPDILTIIVMQMRAEVEERAHDRGEKVEYRRDMSKDCKQLSQVIVRIASEYLASRVSKGGGGVEGGITVELGANARNRRLW